jgi:hypothetical protein
VVLVAEKDGMLMKYAQLMMFDSKQVFVLLLVIKMKPFFVALWKKTGAAESYTSSLVLHCEFNESFTM